MAETESYDRRGSGGPSPASGEVARARAAGRRLEAWFAEAGREFPWRRWRDLYRVAVTEVLLQRTQAPVVAAFVPAFLQKYSGWEAIAFSSVEDLERALSPLGLQRRRARTLQDLALMMLKRRELTGKLPGFGQYVGRAVSVTLRGQRVAMVDANFVRVLRRVFGGRWMSDYRYDRRLQGLAQAVVDGASDSRAVNWAVLDLGATVCKPRNPACARCPLRSACDWANSQEGP